MLSVLVVSFNTRETTLHCLRCLYRSDFTDFEVIVVDNASTDGSVEAIEQQFPIVRMIKNSTNTGFAVANNQAMAVANGDWLLLLNSDAFVYQDTLTSCFAFLAAHPTAAIVGPKLENSDGTLQPSWGYYPSMRRIAAMMLFIDNLPFIRNISDSLHMRVPDAYKKSRQVDWVTGAFVLVKTEAYKRVGGFDERYFMYGEEVEWMYRLRGGKYQIWFTPEAQCIHLGGASSPNRHMAIIQEMKSWIAWFAKYEPNILRNPLIFIILVGCVLRMILKPNVKKAYQTAFGEFLALMNE